MFSHVLCGPLNKVIISFNLPFCFFSSGASWLLGGSQKDHLRIRADNRVPLYLHGARPAPVSAEPHQTGHRCSVGSSGPGWRAEQGCSHLLLSAVGPISKCHRCLSPCSEVECYSLLQIILKSIQLTNLTTPREV